MALIVSILLLILAPFGTMTDTWIFINSLSMVVHMILLNSRVPPNVFYIFKTYLNIIRLSSDKLNEKA